MIAKIQNQKQDKTENQKSFYMLKMENYSSVISDEMNFPFVNINNVGEPQMVYPSESKYTEVRLDDLVFQIHKQVTESGSVSMSIVGKDGGECAEIKFDFSDPEKELLLSGLSYKKNCRIGAEMTRGVQTIKMVKSLIIFALRSYPEFEYVGLMDKSDRDCEDDSSAKIELGDYSYWLYGKTWYQKYFQAIPDILDTSLPRIMNQIDTVMDSVITQDISTIFLRTGSIFPTAAMKHDFISAYDEHKRDRKTWRSFMQYVFSKDSIFSRKYGFQSVCAFFKYVFEKLLVILEISSRISGTLWRIPKEIAQAYPENESIVFKEDVISHIRRRAHTRKMPRGIMRGYGGAWRKASFGKHSTAKVKK